MHVVPQASYGYGLTVSGDVVFHDGATPSGYATAFRYVHAKRFGVVVFLNALNCHSTPSDIAKHVLDVFAAPLVPEGARYTPPEDWDAYVGHYVDKYGVLGDIHVTRESDALFWDAPAFKEKHQLLTQHAGDTWRAPGGAAIQFWRKPGETATYLVTRSGVGTRAP